MGPKKKERDTDHSSSSRGGTNNGHGRAETVQADHELFLQAFESKELDVEFYILVFLTYYCLIYFLWINTLFNLLNFVSVFNRTNTDLSVLACTSYSLGK